MEHLSNGTHVRATGSGPMYRSGGALRMGHSVSTPRFRPGKRGSVVGQHVREDVPGVRDPRQHVVGTEAERVGGVRCRHFVPGDGRGDPGSVSYTHLRAHETGRNLVCRLLLEKKKI